MTDIRCFSSFYLWKIKLLYLFLHLLIQIWSQNHNCNALNVFFIVLGHNNGSSENGQRTSVIEVLSTRSARVSRVTWNIYLFLSLCLVISIFSYPLVYPLTEVVSIFFSIFRDRPLVYFSIPDLSCHSAIFNLSLYISLSIYSYHEMKSAVLKSIVSIFHNGRLLFHWPQNIINLIEKEYKIS